MPFKSVIVKGLGKIKFPASMTDEAIEQSIKNLDMSESARMARAKEQGFDTRRTFYHGTGGDVEGFNPKNLDIKPSSHYYDIGIHGSESPEIANTYAQYSRFPNAAKGMSSGMVGGDPAVYPLLMKASNPLDLTNGVPEDIKSDLIEFAIESGISEKSKYIKLMDSNPNDFMGQLQRKAGREELAEFLNKKGYDGIDYIWQGGKNRVVFDPKNIRSKHAAFNPDLKDSPSLLASSVPLMLGAGAMLKGEDTRADTGAIESPKHPKIADLRAFIDEHDDILMDDMLGGLTSYLDKLSYDDKITMKDRILMALDLL